MLVDTWGQEIPATEENLQLPSVVVYNSNYPDAKVRIVLEGDVNEQKIYHTSDKKWTRPDRMILSRELAKELDEEGFTYRILQGALQGGCNNLIIDSTGKIWYDNRGK